MFDDANADLEFFQNAAARDAKNINLLIRTVGRLVGSASIVEATNPNLPTWLKLLADTHNAIFELAVADSASSVAVPWGDGERKTFGTKIELRSVDVGIWVRACHLNIICRNFKALKMLQEFPLESLRGSSVKGPEYMYTYTHALQIFLRGDGGAVRPALEAINQTDPDRPDITDVDWNLYLHVPEFELFVYVLTDDPKFGEAMRKSLELHKKYWSKTKDRRRDYQGYVSIELTSLALLAQERNLPIDVESPYLVTHLASQVHRS